RRRPNGSGAPCAMAMRSDVNLRIQTHHDMPTNRAAISLDRTRCAGAGLFASGQREEHTDEKIVRSRHLAGQARVFPRGHPQTRTTTMASEPSPTQTIPEARRTPTHHSAANPKHTETTPSATSQIHSPRPENS